MEQTPKLASSSACSRAAEVAVLLPFVPALLETRAAEVLQALRTSPYWINTTVCLDQTRQFVTRPGLSVCCATYCLWVSNKKGNKRNPCSTPWNYHWSVTPVVASKKSTLRLSLSLTPPAAVICLSCQRMWFPSNSASFKQRPIRWSLLSLLAPDAFLCFWRLFGHWCHSCEYKGVHNICMSSKMVHGWNHIGIKVTLMFPRLIPFPDIDLINVTLSQLLAYPHS